MIQRVIVPAAAGLVALLSACGSSSGYSAPSGSGAPQSSSGGVSAASSNTSSANASNSAAAQPTATSTGTVVQAGSARQILLDSAGRTLYLFEADTGTTSMCSGSCPHAWPPLLTVGSPRAGSGAAQAELGTTTRGDGTMQVTYHGHPLYHFINDKKAGDTNGAGVIAFGARWDLVSATGDRLVSSGSGY